MMGRCFSVAACFALLMPSACSDGQQELRGFDCADARCEGAQVCCIDCDGRGICGPSGMLCGLSCAELADAGSLAEAGLSEDAGSGISCGSQRCDPGHVCCIDCTGKSSCTEPGFPCVNAGPCPAVPAPDSSVSVGGANCEAVGGHCARACGEDFLAVGSGELNDCPQPSGEASGNFCCIPLRQTPTTAPGGRCNAIGGNCECSCDNAALWVGQGEANDCPAADDCTLGCCVTRSSPACTPPADCPTY